MKNHEDFRICPVYKTCPEEDCSGKMFHRYNNHCNEIHSNCCEYGKTRGCLTKFEYNMLESIIGELK